MPNFDGTGPLGNGPMTGGGFGRCVPLQQDAFADRGRGGRGFARGLGRGLRLRQRICWSYPYPTEENSAEYGAFNKEAEVLKERIVSLEKNLEEINQKLSQTQQ